MTRFEKVSFEEKMKTEILICESDKLVDNKNLFDKVSCMSLSRY